MCTQVAQSPIHLIFFFTVHAFKSSSTVNDVLDRKGATYAALFLCWESNIWIFYVYQRGRLLWEKHQSACKAAQQMTSRCASIGDVV